MHQYSQKWFNDKNILLMGKLTRSSNLNSIEYHRDILARTVYFRFVAIKSQLLRNMIKKKADKLSTFINLKRQYLKCM